MSNGVSLFAACQQKMAGGYNTHKVQEVRI